MQLADFLVLWTYYIAGCILYIALPSRRFGLVAGPKGLPLRDIPPEPALG